MPRISCGRRPAISAVIKAAGTGHALERGARTAAHEDAPATQLCRRRAVASGCAVARSLRAGYVVHAGANCRAGCSGLRTEIDRQMLPFKARQAPCIRV